MFNMVNSVKMDGKIESLTWKTHLGGIICFGITNHFIILKAISLIEVSNISGEI